MLSSPVIDLAIGLTFVFGVTAALASLLTEFIARFLGLRGAYLLSGLRELVDSGDSPTALTDAETDYKAIQNLIKGPPPAADKAPADEAAAADPTPAADQALPADQAPAGKVPASKEPVGLSVTGALLGGPILGNQGVVGQLASRNLTLAKTTGKDGLPTITSESGSKRSQLRTLPSYISSRSFADAVIDLVVPDPQGQTTMDVIQANLDKLPKTMPFRTSLQALVKNANGDVSKFRTSVEQWYDDHMDRVSGWYKRRVAKITLVVGAIVIVMLNLNALTIGRTLYSENAVSAAVSSVAAKATTCTTADQACLASLDSDLSAAAASGLPVGWGTVRACTQKGVPCGWWERRGILSPFGGDGSQAAQVLLVLLGFLVMIFALLPGAQFWFGLLSKLGTLRSTGPKPAAGG
ncbi:MAG: hypothetical protein WAL72_11630 [Streptosporangiaceae bacterium]